MNKTFKLTAAISLTALAVSACAPNPYWPYPNTNYRGGGAAPNRAPVTHSHNGKVHTHILPPSGLAHTHGGGAAGVANNYRPPANNNYRPVSNPPPSNTYGYYDYGNYRDDNKSSSSYYDYSTPKPRSNYYNNYDKNYDNGGNYYDYSSSSDSSSSSSSTTYSPNTYNGGNDYVVQKGDTVFQVMRNTGTYWKDIIRLNDLAAPDYKIVPGQRLRLK